MTFDPFPKMPEPRADLEGCIHFNIGHQGVHLDPQRPGPSHNRRDFYFCGQCWRTVDGALVWAKVKTTGLTGEYRQAMEILSPGG